MSDVIGVMHTGKLVEYGSTEEIFSAPKQEYTRTLIESVPYIPRPGGKRVRQPRVEAPDVGAHVESLGESEKTLN
jgi:ABC-type oligopeptide transport system ATPase subunit